jgi:hypothetical protein
MSKLLSGLAASALLFAIALPGSADAAQRAQGLSNPGDYEVSGQYRRRYARPYYPRRFYARRYYAPRYYPRRFYARPYYAPRRFYVRRYYAPRYYYPRRFYVRPYYAPYYAYWRPRPFFSFWWGY